MNDKIQAWALWVHKQGVKGYLVTGLLLVMFLMWGRLLLKEVPRVSTAAPVPVPNQIAGTDGLRPDLIKPPVLESVLIEDTGPLSRDPFGFDPSPYNRTESPVFQDAPLRPQAESPDADAVVAELRRNLSRLEIQSIVGGQPPRVMIDGRVLRPGDTIEGFEIVAINYAERTVDFRQHGHTLRQRQ